jgi:putative transcriptional regulator
MPIDIKLDYLMVINRISVKDMSKKTRITLSNLSRIKNNRVKSIRISTLDSLCNILKCTPGDLLEYTDKEPIRVTRLKKSPLNK